jgi:hypothetical protein
MGATLAPFSLVLLRYAPAAIPAPTALAAQENPDRRAALEEVNDGK